MTDPQRLLSSTSDADDLERELLASIQRVDPPSAAKGEAWSKLSAQVAAVGLVSATHGSAGAVTSGAAAAPGTSAGVGAAIGWAPALLNGLAGKLILGLAVVSTAIGASALWMHGNHAKSAVLAPSAVPLTLATAQTQVVAPTEASPEAPAVVLPAPAPALQPEAPARPSVEQSPTDRLSAESALLTKARAELRRGDPATAQRILEQMRAKFPKGVLGQEREVLSIEVLAARGNTEAARRRARAFVAAYPKSPHSAQLTRFAEAP